MSTFNTEWVTIEGPSHCHRVMLESRLSHPDRELNFLAEAAARLIDLSGAQEARVTKVFSDEKSGSTWITVASTDPKDEVFCRSADDVLRALSKYSPYVTFTLVQRGSTLSDHYDHMKHLSDNSI